MRLNKETAKESREFPYLPMNVSNLIRGIAEESEEEKFEIWSYSGRVIERSVNWILEPFSVPPLPFPFFPPRRRLEIIEDRIFDVEYKFREKVSNIEEKIFNIENNLTSLQKNFHSSQGKIFSEVDKLSNKMRALESRFKEEMVIFKKETEENTYKQLKENIYKPGALGISCSALLMGFLSLIWSPYLAIPLLGLGAYSYWVYRKLSV